MTYIFAQEEAETKEATGPWTKGLNSSATFTQTSLSNWAAGGQNAVNLNVYGKVFLNYVEGKNSWENSLELAFGLLKQEDNGFRKSDDKFDFLTKYNHQLSNEKLFFSSFINFKSQIANGFIYDETGASDLISRFAAPAFLFVTAGLEYKPKAYFSIYYSPITNKNTVVLKDNNIDETAYGLDSGKTWRFEGGSLLRLYFKKELFKNVSLESKVEFFTNYFENFGNIDVNWENALVMQINKHLSTNFFTHLIYDDDIDIVDNYDPKLAIASDGPRLQFKQVFGLGLTYVIGN